MTDHQKVIDLRHKITHWEREAERLADESEAADAKAHAFEMELDQLLARLPITPVITKPS